jgi:hypothetical protein
MEPMPGPPDRRAQRLVSEVKVWEKQRNDTGERVKWMSTTDRAGEAGPRLPRVPKSQNLCDEVLARLVWTALQ